MAAIDVRTEVVDLARDLIRIDTSNPPGNEAPAAHLLYAYLEEAGLECELVARDVERPNLVARLRGAGNGPSLALLGHTDVVPADEPDWTHPPFAGHLTDDGWLWGRGAVDMKNQTATRAVTIATLAREGFRPSGDLVLIAEADEEDGTDAVGMNWLVHERPDLRVDYAIDEGGGDRIVLRDGRVLIAVETGQKAVLPVAIAALGVAGHASRPQSGANAVPLLATLISRIAAFAPERRLLPATRRMLELLVGPVDGDLEAAIARAMSDHVWAEENLPALFSTTMAPTRIVGSSARNVMPARAIAEIDCRILPGTTKDDLERELRSALGDDIPYELTFLDEITGGAISEIDTPLWNAIQGWADAADPGAQLLPIISTGFGDSHYLREVWGTVAHGFWPYRTTPVDVHDSGFHNVNERVHVDDLVYATEAHLEIVRTLLG